MISPQWHCTIFQMIIHNRNCFVKVCIDKANPLWIERASERMSECEKVESEKKSHAKAQVKETGQAWDWNSITNISFFFCFCNIAYEFACVANWMVSFSFMNFFPPSRCFFYLIYKIENEMRAYYSISTDYMRWTCSCSCHSISFVSNHFLLKMCTIELNG